MGPAGFSIVECSRDLRFSICKVYLPCNRAAQLNLVKLLHLNSLTKKGTLLNQAEIYSSIIATWDGGEVSIAGTTMYHVTVRSHLLSEPFWAAELSWEDFEVSD